MEGLLISGVEGEGGSSEPTVAEAEEKETEKEGGDEWDDVDGKPLPYHSPPSLTLELTVCGVMTVSTGRLPLRPTRTPGVRPVRGAA